MNITEYNHLERRAGRGEIHSHLPKCGEMTARLSLVDGVGTWGPAATLPYFLSSRERFAGFRAELRIVWRAKLHRPRGCSCSVPLLTWAWKFVHDDVRDVSKRLSKQDL